MPAEIRARAAAAAGGDVGVDVTDKRGEAYVPPPYRAFGGAGASASGGAPAAAPAAGAVVPAEGGGRAPPPPPPADGAPSSTLLVKLLDGRREKIVVNPTLHTVADVQTLVAALRGTAKPFVLLAGFPPKPIGADGAATTTVEAAGLKGAALQQKEA